MSRFLTIVKKILGAWDSFFHRQTDLSIFGPIRIAYAAAMLINILAWWPDVDKWFGENGVLTLQASRFVIDPDTITIFQWLPTTSAVLWVCYLLLIFSTIGLLLGVFTRFQLVCVFVLYTSFVHRNILLFDGQDILFRVMAFYLFFSPAGKYCSIDSWWTSRRARGRNLQPKTLPVWPLRLIQIQTAAVLLFSGIEKCCGHEWLDGTAIYYVSRLDDLFCRFPVPEFLFKSMLIMSLVSWATLAIELVVPIAIWFKKTRRVSLIMVLAFHLTLDYMCNLNLFQWLMIIGWMSFIESDDIAWVRSLFRWKRRAETNESTVELLNADAIAMVALPNDET